MRPYVLNALHKLQAEGNFGQKRLRPSEAMLEAVYNQKLYAGYSKKRNPVCSTCHEMKSSSGVCSCTE